MDASLMKASALRLRFSQSLASRRQRLSQAMVRSTTQRLGWTTKPLIRALAVETHEDWLEANRYINMKLLTEHKRELMKQAA